MYTLNEFNKLSKKKAGIELFNCCGSAKWVKQLLNYFPFENEELLFDLTRMAWYETCEKIDFLEAFSHHPRIGDVNSLRKKLANTKHWAGAEQAGVKEAQEKTIQELVKWNEKFYFQKFGYIFIVCATGKTADEMLQLLKARMDHTKSEELHVAMGEQFKITLIRLKKLIKLKKSFLFGLLLARLPHMFSEGYRYFRRYSRQGNMYKTQKTNRKKLANYFTGHNR